MDKKMTMIIAVIVVAIVAAAGCFALMNNNSKNNDSGDTPVDPTPVDPTPVDPTPVDPTPKDPVYPEINVEDSKLHIRGNANNDETIDSKDMAIVDDIIAGKKTLQDYPLADVNADGYVNATDKTLLQNLIDRKDGSDIYIVCLDVNGETTTVKATYPLRNVVTYGTNIQLPCLHANGGKYVAGYFVSAYEVAEASFAPTAVDLKGAARTISDAAWTNFTKLDSTISGGIGAFLIDYSGIAQITEPRVKDLNDAMIPTVIYSSADAQAEVTTVLTLGFLFGGDNENVGKTYAELSWAIFDEINSKVGGLSDSEKTTYISCTMYIYVCQNDSTFNSSGIDAGGLPYYKINSEFAEKYKGASSSKMTSTEALSNYTDAGCILNNRSIDWGLNATEVKNTIKNTWDHDNSGISSTEYYRGFEDKLAYINNLLPGAVKVAYMAHALYGDIFSEAWANDNLQKFIDSGSEPLKGQTLDTVVAFIDKSVYERSQATLIASSNAVDIVSTVVSALPADFATGVDSAAYSFVKGSNEIVAYMSVANASPFDYEGFGKENMIAVVCGPDAEKYYYEVTTKLKNLDGTTLEGYAYKSINVKSQFDGIMGYYVNMTDKGASYLIVVGYADEAYFCGTFFKSTDIDNTDAQGIVDAYFDGLYNTVKYTGPAIPSDVEYEGAELIAHLFADERAAWSVSDESTTEKAVLIYTYVNAMGNEKTAKVYVTIDGTTYGAAAETVKALDGTPASTRGSYTFNLVTEEIAGVEYTAVIGQLSSSGYLRFAMQAGNIVFSAADENLGFLGADVSVEAIALLKDVAEFVSSDEAQSSLPSTGAKLFAETFADNQPAWTAGEGDADVATLVFTYVNAMGNEKTAKVTVYANTEAYAAAEQAVKALDGTPASTRGSYTFNLVTEEIAGVEYTAVIGQLSSSGYLRFAMQANGYTVDASAENLGFLGADISAEALAVLKAVAEFMVQ